MTGGPSGNNGPGRFLINGSFTQINPSENYILPEGVVLSMGNCGSEPPYGVSGYLINK